MSYKTCIYFAICCAHLSSAQIPMESRGLMENIDYGIKYAGKLFGINTAADVAELVSRAFKQANKLPNDNASVAWQDKTTEPVPNESKQQQQQQQKPVDNIFAFNTPQLLTAVLRMIGFDVNKLGALAINALIFLVQTIGSNLITTKNTNNMYQEQYNVPNERQSRILQTDTPIDWFLKAPNANMNQLLNTALDANLTQRLQNIVKSAQNNETNSNCLKILLCRSVPFIKSMQVSLEENLDRSQGRIVAKRQILNDTAKNSKIKDLYANMPSLQQYQQQVNICKQKYGNSCF